MSKWKLRSLLASWVAWWLVLILWGIWPAIGPIWRVSRPDARGNASVSFGDGGFHAAITEAGGTAWQGDISFLKLVLLAGIPPIILWILWQRAQKRQDRDPDLLSEGPVDLGRLGRRRSKRARKAKAETNDYPGPFV